MEFVPFLEKKRRKKLSSQKNIVCKKVHEGRKGERGGKGERRRTRASKCDKNLGKMYAPLFKIS